MNDKTPIPPARLASLATPATPAMTPIPREVIACYLETAARLLRRHPDGRRDDSICWRVADAGLALRHLLEAEGCTDTGGLDRPTGMGALLPSKRIPK